MAALYVYIIGNSKEGLLKIGASNSPKSRIASLQTNCHFKLSLLKKWATDYAFEVERVVHYELREHRMHGEWFKCSLNIAIDTIQDVMNKTSKGKDLSCYAKKKAVVKSIAAQKAGNASGKKAKARTKMAVDKIKERWGMPSNIWPTKMLLKEADVSLNSVKSILGSRIVAQANFKAAQKRKERSAKGIRYKRADNYVDEVPDYVKE